MVEKEGERKYNAYTRREFLKLGGRVAASAAVYGAGGYYAGRLYKEYIKPPIEKVQAAADKISRIEKKAKSFWPFKKIRQEEVEPSEYLKEETTRRGFLRALLGNYVHAVHEHPIPTLTATGVAYGGAKSALGNMSKYKDKIEIARLKDKNQEHGDKISELEEELAEMRNRGIPGEKPEEPSKVGQALIGIGIAGVIFSLISSISFKTGYAIATEVTPRIIHSEIIFLITSLLLILIGLKKCKLKG